MSRLEAPTTGKACVQGYVYTPGLKRVTFDSFGLSPGGGVIISASAVLHCGRSKRRAVHVDIDTDIIMIIALSTCQRVEADPTDQAVDTGVVSVEAVSRATR